ncbi:MAG: hypothetical protein WA117_19910 [Verrucomicrobiia bacterium]
MTPLNRTIKKQAMMVAGQTGSEKETDDRRSESISRLPATFSVWRRLVLHQQCLFELLAATQAQRASGTAVIEAG